MTVNDPVTIASPFTSSFAFGVVVPIPTFPLRAVVVTLSLPNTTVFEPKPNASVPITI